MTSCSSGEAAATPWRGPVRRDQPGLGNGGALVGGCGNRGHDLADLLAERLGLLGQVGGQVPARPTHGERGHLVVEHTDVTTGHELQVGHGALEIEVRIVLPGEADPTEDLDALLGAVRRCLQCDVAGDGRAQGPAVLVGMFGRILAPGGGGVPGHRGTLARRPRACRPARA